MTMSATACDAGIENYHSFGETDPDEYVGGEKSQKRCHMLRMYISLALLLLLSGCGSAESNGATPAVDATPDSDRVSPASGVNEHGLEISDERIIGVVNAVMKEQYGDKFNAKYLCWEFSTESDGRASNYCMQPAPAELVDTKTGKQLYLRAASVPDIADDSRYEYNQIDPGRMGVFNLRIEDDGSWTYLAANKAMAFGTVGYCGCDQAKLVKLSNDGVHGWMFVSGGVWQGIVVSHHSIVAPLNGAFMDLSAIPEIPEDEQTTKYEIDVDAKTSDGLFPLRVAKLESGKKLEEITVSFDTRSSRYSLPGSE